MVALKYLFFTLFIVYFSACGKEDSEQITDSLINLNKKTPVGLSTGYDHSCSITSAGTVECWGANSSGQLGNNSTTDSQTRVDVAGLSDVIAISAGNSFNCALLNSQSVKCWGNNDHGQLGNGTTNNALTPVDVTGLAGVNAISVGIYHSCALLNTGKVKCWGQNSNGELGNGTTTDSLIPVEVTGLTGVTAVSAAITHSCAVLDTGGVKCWGNNLSGQLGNGTTTDSLIPVDVSGLTGATAISVGYDHTCVVLSSGGVKCWGRNYDGQLGNNKTSDSKMPVEVTGFSSGVSAVEAGRASTCVLLSTGGVQCWGNNSQGQLGNATRTLSLIPVEVTGLSSGVTTLSLGRRYHACVRMTGDRLKCWGNNSNGQLGNGVSGYSKAPVTVVGVSPSAGVDKVSVDSNSACSLTSEGGVKCWGQNSNGELGDGTTTDYLSPVQVTGLSSGVTAVSRGNDFTCALLNSGGVKCWGHHFYGQLGNSTIGGAGSATAVDVTGLSNVTAISAGGFHACALQNTGIVKCWGANLSGQLGNGNKASSASAVDVTGLAGVTTISAGYKHTCAVLNTGEVKCWGSDQSGQLGNGGSDFDSSSAVTVTGLSGVIALSAGYDHTCAVLNTGGVKCWGGNSLGQLGNNSTTDSGTTVNVTDLTGVTAISAGYQHTCALLDTGGVQCWGSN